VTCILIDRQQLAKHLLAEANAQNNRTSVARQGHGKHTLSTIEAVFSVWSVPRVYKRTQSVDRLERILTMVYVVQSYWACFGLYPSSCVWKTKDHNVSEIGFVSILRWMGAG
jgi:hypothetical protein